MVLILHRWSGSVVACAFVVGAATVESVSPEGESRAAAGERIYREGILLDGTPVTALVQGDVPINGAQFSCVSCHRRSGWGATEGDVIVLSVAGPALFEPRTAGYRRRRAYDDETLARALREGVDPTGQLLDPLMPRYELNDEDMAALTAYLRVLSSTPSPGVSDERIHIGTIVTEDVEPARQRAMLDVIETYIKEKNALTRNERRRLVTAPFYRESKDKAYREWVLHTWRLEGEPSSWREQLQAHYERQPVFALVSGVSSRDWRPIHEFCESELLPCLLPNTDRPILSETDYYTVYFSKGLSFDAELIAADVLRSEESRRSVLQVFREESAGSAGAAALRALSQGDDRLTVVDFVLRGDGPIDVSPLAGHDAVALWLDAEDLGRLSAPPPGKFYLSATLLGADEERVPRSLQPRATLVSPYRLQKERQDRLRRVEAWLRTRDIPMVDQRLQEQTYFACMMLGEGIKHIRRYFYREYFLEILDHADRMATLSAFYPRLGIAPGQRYLAKGAYLIDFLAGDPPASTWLVP